MDPVVELAKNSIESYIKYGKKIQTPDKLEFQKPSGVFVSIHNKDGSLRGCIGTFLATKDSLGEEIINNTIAAATEDPRFPSISESELDNLKISVDILSEPFPIKNRSELDPKKYGVIVKGDFGKSGLLLPDLEGVDTIEEQLKIACQKAGIDYNKENYQILAFTVERHE
ncbi:MAG: AmmeMemoRadiSam system protein A [Patescibacteria group bacterium]